jgi:hypothetical protein
MPLCARILLAFLTCNVLAQQASTRVPISGLPARVGSPEAIVSLLQQSHELNNQFSLPAQYSLLRHQVDLASTVQPELGRQWASELLLLAGQMKGPARSDAQDFAMTILARHDPEHAEELLRTMHLNDAGKDSSPFQVRSQVMQQVFNALVQRDGEAALPTIEREAAYIGSTETYPYSAVGQATVSAVSKDWLDKKDHAIQVSQSALDRMFARYSTTPHTYYGDIEFGQMLNVLGGGLPLESIKLPLHLVVTNLLATDTSKYQYHAEVYTSDGQIARADNAVDASLLWLAQLIDRDPELTQQLESTRPQLREALESTKSGRIHSRTFGGGAGPPKPMREGPISQAARDAMRLTHANPDAAVARAEALPAGAERSRTLLQVARGISGSKPDQAAQLVAEVSSAIDAGDDEMQLDVISVKTAIAAGKGDQEGVKNLLHSGYELAARFISAQTRPFLDGLGGLVQLGIQNDPELTMRFFQQLPASELKAHLLLAAAEGLNLRKRLP